VKKILTLLVALFVTVTSHVFAQTSTGKGKIAGKVFDKNTNEALIGLAVVIEGSTTGGQTNVEGRYEIANLAPGTYKVVFKYVSYQTKVVSDIQVTAGKVTNLDLAMEESATSLTEVVVTSTYKKETIGAMYTLQKNNISISDGISADIIKRSPDKNTSEVLKRVSGASIQDNKFVIVRGLSDRYNVAMINNAVLPSSEPDRKAFSFDIIPSNLIDRITINKTASADLPGDFAGGVVQVYTKDIPDENYLDFSVGYGLNTQSTFKKFKSNGRGAYDYFGFSDGSRDLPDNFPGSRQKYASAGLANQVKATRSLANSYGEQESVALPSQSYQVTLGNKKGLKNDASFGTIVSMTYRNAQTINPVERMDYDGPNAFYNYDDKQYKFNTSIGALANFAYIKGSTKIAFKNLFNRSFEETYSERSGYNLNNLNDIRLNSNELIQKSLFNTQLEGDHLLGFGDIKLNWNVNYAAIARNQPDLRTIFYQRPIDQGDAGYTLVDRNSRRFFSNLNEDNFGGNLSASIPFKLFQQKNSVKVGGMALLKRRDFAARIFNYAPASVNFNDSLLSLPMGSIFDEQNIGTEGFILNEFTNNNDKYYAASDLYTGFVSFDNQFSNNIRLNWGVRVESYAQNIDAKDASAAKVSVVADNIDVLPSANLTYSVSQKTNMRLSASQTVSRPEFRELAPFEFFDFINTSSLSGNPALKRSRNFNLDTRYEYYPSPGEAITGSVFYKNFKDPIEQVANSASNADRRVYTYDNAREANAYGVEIEFRKRLDFIAAREWLSNMTIFANAAYIHSVVDLANQGGLKRSLQGQSPYLVNSGIQYSSNENSFAVGLLYNRVGQRISIVGYQGYADIYESARDVIDIQLSKKVWKKQGELKLNISDVLAQDVIFYQNSDNNKVFDHNQDRVISRANYGTGVSLSFAYNIGLGRK
jgi:hypothetical protein